MTARLFPLEASANAPVIDRAFFSVLAISLVIFLLLLVLVLLFSFRYRRGSEAKRGLLPKLIRREFEIGWTSAITFLAIFIFWWFVGGIEIVPRAAPNPLEIHVLAKQWMWKAEHADGAREIDALHLPLGRQVRLIMTSDDVIHSFYMPEFRLKQDVLPGRDTELIFTPTAVGTFHLFCAEYCGTQHSHMTGQIVVMSGPDYSAWLKRQPLANSFVRQGEALYEKFACGACHAAKSQARAPKLEGLFGHNVTLQDGSQMRAGDAYIRESILNPRAQIVAGYGPAMPSYAQLLKPSEADALVAYIKSLQNPGKPP